ncbi:magnesium transporter [Rhizobiales bacterium GAS191]|nr:magnesium transporter [Rhizobiales bacterium GAS191]
MIIIHRLEPRTDGRGKVATLVQHQLSAGEPIPADTVWVDLFEPTRDEQQAAELFAGISLPTPEEMDEIEPSELLYADDGARYMTARVLCLAKTHRPKIANVSFIRKANTFVTVRYDDPKPFQTFAARAQRSGLAGNDAEAVFVGLIDAIVGRAGEILRGSGDSIDALSEGIFELAGHKGRPQTGEYQKTLATLGREGGRISKARESLVSIELMLRFASAGDEPGGEDDEPHGHIGTMLRDISSLETHTEYLLGKVQFLLDTILGLVNLSQNDIIKILSVITVVFTPPTFFASMYGMNFKNIPEYDWSYGYQYGLVLMLLSAILPYVFFRWKKWL